MVNVRSSICCGSESSRDAEGGAEVGARLWRESSREYSLSEIARGGRFERLCLRTRSGQLQAVRGP